MVCLLRLVCVCVGARVRVFVPQSHGNELWVMLLEKAYAKLHGTYSNLRFGFTHEALIVRIVQQYPSLSSSRCPLQCCAVHCCAVHY